MKVSILKCDSLFMNKGANHRLDIVNESVNVKMRFVVYKLGS